MFIISCMEIKQEMSACRLLRGELGMVVEISNLCC